MLFSHFLDAHVGTDHHAAEVRCQSCEPVNGSL